MNFNIYFLADKSIKPTEYLDLRKNETVHDIVNFLNQDFLLKKGYCVSDVFVQDDNGIHAIDPESKLIIYELFTKYSPLLVMKLKNLNDNIIEDSSKKLKSLRKSMDNMNSSLKKTNNSLKKEVLNLLKSDGEMVKVVIYIEEYNKQDEITGYLNDIKLVEENVPIDSTKEEIIKIFQKNYIVENMDLYSKRSRKKIKTLRDAIKESQDVVEFPAFNVITFPDQDVVELLAFNVITLPEYQEHSVKVKWINDNTTYNFSFFGDRIVNLRMLIAQELGIELYSFEILKSYNDEYVVLSDNDLAQRDETYYISS